jgi:hypothetical protein
MNAICTITTRSHLHKVFALADSVQSHNVSFCVLVLDDLTEGITHPAHLDSKVEWLMLRDLDSEKVTALIQKFGRFSDELRWALKPLFLKYLCLKKNNVCYVDNDICFYESSEVIFEKLTDHQILLTPHFYPHTPEIKGANWFEANFQVGIYNAGFIGVRNDALDFLDWWYHSCLYDMRKSYFRGLFDDQKYLDLVPTIFPSVYIHPKPTWNFAAWNDWYPGLQQRDDKLFIDEEPIVFIHYTSLSLKEFAHKAHLANSNYAHYLTSLAHYQAGPLTAERKFSKRNIKNYLRFLFWRFLTRK